MRQPAAAVLVLGALVAGGPAIAADERVISYSTDALTVRLAQVPLSEVVDEIGRQAGAEIRGQVRSAGEVTAEFDAVPLPEALHRLLGDQNFALIYGDAGKLKAVRLLGGPQTPPEPAIVVPSPPPLPPMQAAPANLASLVARLNPVLVTGHLAEVVGSSNASLQQLFEIGTRNQDSTTRAEAVRAIVSTLEGDSSLRTAVVGELGTLDDASLSALLRSAAGEHAEEVARQILAHSRASELRVRAASVLRNLRAGS